MKKVFSIIYICGLAASISGCSSIPKKQIQEAAAKDLDCMSVRIKVEKIAGDNYAVNGCGKSGKYRVKGCVKGQKCVITKL